jgi:hypothetical protein
MSLSGFRSSLIPSSSKLKISSLLLVRHMTGGLKHIQNKFTERSNIFVSESSFDYIRLNNGLYIDKTREIYNSLLVGGKYYFLVRPRRFGKSLLCSTLSNLFGGYSKRVLYEDLWIGRNSVWDFEKEEHE